MGQNTTLILMADFNGLLRMMNEGVQSEAL
jgi:hypothetical protein